MDEGHDHAENADGTWTCSMHPQVQQDAPGQCPFCGMALIPLQDNSDDNDPSVLKMSESAMKLANIQTMTVLSGISENQIRVNGKIETDESRVKNQVLHIPGRIERLFVDFTGQSIRRGQKIATIYSPELVTAQKELKEALRLADKYPTLVEAARRKFENWKLSTEQVRALETSLDLQTRFDIIADISGVVTVKNVQVGDHLMQGAPLYEVSDLSRVWVLFDVYEQDLQAIRTGDVIDFSVKAFPGEEFMGKVEFIDPVIDPRTRTAAVRISANNRDQRLKPEMLAEGMIKNGKGASSAISIPKSAVLWTGKRSIVYRQLRGDEPRFQMQEVTLGTSMGDAYIVTEGLKEGDLIVVNGTFSVDAAAQLQGKPSMMNQTGGKVMLAHNHEGSRAEMTEPMQEGIEVNLFMEVKPVTEEVPTKFKNQLGLLIEGYLKLKDHLIAAENHKAAMAASDFEKQLASVDGGELGEESKEVWTNSSSMLRQQIQLIGSKHEIATQRTAFITLSEYMIRIVRAFKPSGDTIYVQHCPMANNDIGANWLSKEEKVLNPYYGDMMLNCGWVEQEIGF